MQRLSPPLAPSVRFGRISSEYLLIFGLFYFGLFCFFSFLVLRGHTLISILVTFAAEQMGPTSTRTTTFALAGTSLNLPALAWGATATVAVTTPLQRL